MRQVVKPNGDPFVIKKELFVPDVTAKPIIGNMTKSVMNVKIVAIVKV
jgi:hypothetical protein